MNHSNQEGGARRTNPIPFYGGPCPHREGKSLCGLVLYSDPVAGSRRLLCTGGHKFVSDHVTSSGEKEKK